MQKKRNKANTKTSRKKTISGTFAIAAGAVAITGAAVMVTTPSAHAETQTTMSITKAAVNDAEKKEGENAGIAKRNVAETASSSAENTNDASASFVATETADDKTQETEKANTDKVAEKTADTSVSKSQSNQDLEKSDEKTETDKTESTQAQIKQGESDSESTSEASSKTGSENISGSENAKSKSDTTSENAQKSEDKDAATNVPDKSLETSEPVTSEKVEKISDKTEEKADENGGSTKTRTEVYQHEKTTVTKTSGDPDEDEKEANRDENGNAPVKKHVTETEKETWEETRTTTETVTKKPTGDDRMTNADDYSKKTVYTVGEDGKAKEADNNVSEKVKDFLDKQNITSDFAVYAGSLDDTIGHEDGNIAVDKLNKGTTVMNKDGQYAMNSGLSLSDVGKAYANSGYSYIGETKDGQYISSSSNFQTGGKNDALVIYGEKEGNSFEDTNGSANHFRSVHMKNGETILEKDRDRTSNLEKVKKIRENLKEIGKAGTAVTVSVKDNLSDEKKLKTAVDIIKSKMLSKDDVLTFNLSAHVLKNDGSAGEYNQVNNLLTSLVNENTSKVNILINVEIDKSMLSDGKTLKDLWGMMNGIQNYDHKASYLTWNFGDFDGKIVIGNTVSGNFIAPNATLNVNGIESGRMVADSASHSGEIHMAVKGDYQKNYVTETKTDTKVSESEHKKEKFADVKYEYEPKEAPSEHASEASSQAHSEATSETHSQAESQASSETHSETTSEHASEASSQAHSEASSETHSQAESQASSETHSEATSEHASESQTPFANFEKGSESVSTSQVHNNTDHKNKEASSASEETGGENMSDHNTLNDGHTEKTEETYYNKNKTHNTAGETAMPYYDTATGTYKLNKYSANANAYEAYAKAEKGVKTGDKTNLLGSIVAFLTSGGIIAYLLGKKKRKNG